MRSSTLRASYVTSASSARRHGTTLATMACIVLLTACATRPSSVVAPAPAPAPARADAARLTVAPGTSAPAPAAAAPAPTPQALLLATADELVGTRYRYGGTSPKSGFDCSGFVRWVYSQQGIDLPRTTRGLTTAGTRIPARRAELLPGDLLLFAGHGTRITHVAIYVGDGRIIHASSGQREVRYDDLDSSRGRWFRRHVVSARRVIAAARFAAAEAR